MMLRNITLQIKKHVESYFAHRYQGFVSRKHTLLTQIDFLIDTLQSNKFDIVYMEKLKMPLSPDEHVYFMQQVDRINSSIKILLWMRNNIVANTRFWTKFFVWRKV